MERAFLPLFRINESFNIHRKDVSPFHVRRRIKKDLGESNKILLKERKKKSNKEKERKERERERERDEKIL